MHLVHFRSLLDDISAVVSSWKIKKLAFEVKVQLVLRAVVYIMYAVVFFMYYQVPIFSLPQEWIGTWPSYFLRLPFSPISTFWSRYLRQSNSRRGEHDCVDGSSEECIAVTSMLFRSLWPCVFKLIADWI